MFGETSWKTYGQVAEEAKAFGAGLLTLGLKPCPEATAASVVRDFAAFDGPHALVIFEETCADWTTACIGAMGQSIAVATSYATLGMPAVAEALNQTQAPAILCNSKDVERLAAFCEAQCKTLTTVIYTTNYVEDGSTAPPASIGRLKVVSMAAVVEAGRAAPAPFAPPTPDHVGLIMYTSGSTGKPKGARMP